MRTWEKILASCAASAIALASSEATAQTPVPPIVERDSSWGTVSDTFLVLGAATVSLMPRVYFQSDPKAKGNGEWRASWHFSVLAPTLTLVAVATILEFPGKEGSLSWRPGCSVEQTMARFPGSNCESFGGPSLHAFGAWSAAGAGVSIFLVDTIKYSGGRFNVPAFFTGVLFPLGSAILVDVARGVDIDNDANPDGILNPVTLQPYEREGQILAGSLSGFLSGLTLGFAYAMLQPPSCDRGAVVCW